MHIREPSNARHFTNLNFVHHSKTAAQKTKIVVVFGFVLGFIVLSNKLQSKQSVESVPTSYPVLLPKRKLSKEIKAQ